MPFPGPASDKQVAARKRIAVIEDHSDSRELMSIMLDGVYDVVTYPTAEDALERLRSDNPDLIITDLLLPNLHGADLLKRLRSQGVRCPAIAFTASVVQGVRDATLAQGFDEFVTKPVIDVEQFLALIERVAKAQQSKLTA